MQKKLGVLCHVSSIPSDYGIGDFGRSAREFIDFLYSNNINIWQVLPLNETNSFNCPYASNCFFSFDPMFVDVEQLLIDGLLYKEELKPLKKLSRTNKVIYDAVKREKFKLLDLAFDRLSEAQKNEVTHFFKCNKNQYDYAYFKAVMETSQQYDWREIDKDLWNKKSLSYKQFKEENKDIILKFGYIQYLLSIQWRSVRDYANSKSILILGDIPIYPDPNSFDVCHDREQFLLDKRTFKPLCYGGVPKDDFCENGQNWGTCVYDWQKQKEKAYKYLIDKIKILTQRYDILRLDHYFGYVRHYEHSSIKSGYGKWVRGGGEEFFKALAAKINIDSIVVEDLGLHNAEASRVKNKFGLRGMSVVQMILESQSNLKYLPQFVGVRDLYYLGTHDHNTFIGWLSELSNETKQQFCDLLKVEFKNNKQVLLDCIRKMLDSPSEMIVFQIQDLLMQGAESRMNKPGIAADQWEYKVPKHYQKLSRPALKLIQKIRGS